MLAVMPFVKQMTPDEKNEFMDDYVKLAQSSKAIFLNENDPETNIASPYKQMVIYARK